MFVRRIVVLCRVGPGRSRTGTSGRDEWCGAALVIAHVTVIDVETGKTLPDMSVVVEGERIAQVGPAREVKIPKGAQVVDGAGKFLIPGLWDMHVHTFFGEQAPAGRNITLPLFVANGITGVRDMGSNLDEVLQARADIAAGKLLGPRMIVAGPMLDGPKTQFPASIAITTPEDGRRAVDMLVARGVDFIKIQSYVPREAYFAIVDECKKKNIVFVGHVPDAIRGSEASNAGQKSFEHLIGIFEGSSTAEDQLLKGPKGPGKFLETYDPQKEAALIALLEKNQTWQCPTLFWERGQWLVDAIDVTKDPDAEVRSGIVARPTLAQIHKIDHQGTRHRPAAGARKIRGRMNWTSCASCRPPACRCWPGPTHPREWT